MIVEVHRFLKGLELCLVILIGCFVALGAHHLTRFIFEEINLNKQIIGFIQETHQVNIIHSARLQHIEKNNNVYTQILCIFKSFLAPSLPYFYFNNFAIKRLQFNGNLNEHKCRAFYYSSTPTTLKHLSGNLRNVKSYNQVQVNIETFITFILSNFIQIYKNSY